LDINFLSYPLRGKGQDIPDLIELKVVVMSYDRGGELMLSGLRIRELI
jgi:hypothetical protein